ncbi:MAG: dethiobiotin synthase [Myxococcales bacterium]|nr:dethiobiotin synthase [Polyangiaceae bacterium]MDW8248533.1 dethiobiotin synthase [Myxococcales bacterium]
MVIVAGTGTDVGKTFVTCALLTALRRRGARVGAWKPVASGVEGGCSPDSDAYATALGAPVAPPLYAFLPPVSPHLAARQAGVTLTIDALAARARALAEGHEVFLVETAGGLFTPLSEHTTNADLAWALGGRLLLVAPDRLGVLHDLGAALRAARGVGLGEVTVVLSAPERPDASTGSNAGEVERTLGQRVAAVFPRGKTQDAAVVASAEATLAALGLCSDQPSSIRERPRP